MVQIMENRQKQLISRTAANWKLRADAAKLFVDIMPQVKETTP